MKISRVMIAAGSSGSGKTLIQCGIIKAFQMMGKTVQSFKCGPDYIDPMFHKTVLGRESRNLDLFLSDQEVVKYLLKENGKEADISLIEGVMGYYDGMGVTTEKASSYELAKFTDTPVILVVNGKGMSLSIIALIAGFLNYRQPSMIRGIILNQVSPMLYHEIKKEIEEELPVRVLGYLPNVPEFKIDSRYLGLVIPEEIEDIHNKLEGLGRQVLESIDLFAIMEIAKNTIDLKSEYKPLKKKYDVTIALAKDEAFCFIYHDNIRFLEEMGAKIVEFSPVKDKKLPEGIDGLLLYGGYPELYAKELSENISMIKSIKKFSESKKPIMAECGGFMYLHETLENENKDIFNMAGAIKGNIYNTKKLSRFGYINLAGNNVFGRNIGEIKAHEYHYYDSTNCGTDFLAKKPSGKRQWNCIHSEENIFAGFPHQYYYGNPSLPLAFLEACQKGEKE